VTPAEVYALPVQGVERDLRCLKGCYYDFLPELGDDPWNYGAEEIASDRAEVRVVFQFHYDYRRYWRLATVWLDGAPVMVTQNAGREGDDHRARFVTDEGRYRELLALVRSLLPVRAEPVADLVDPGADCGDRLTEFYHARLGGHFERSRY
jgi:hypothetical protein